MPYIQKGCLTYAYAIRLKTGRIQDRKNDPYIFISMTCRKRIQTYLHYFMHEVSDNDSFNHNDVRARLNFDPNEKFYVTLVTRFKYHPEHSRKLVENLQLKHNTEIEYPQI